MKALLFTLLFSLLQSVTVSAQHNRRMNSDVPVYPNDSLLRFQKHSAIKPYVDVDFEHRSHLRDGAAASDILPRESWKTAYTKPSLVDQNLRRDEAHRAVGFVVKPLYALMAGKDLRTDYSLLTTAGGFTLAADYRQKFGMEARVAAGTITFPSYQDSLAKHRGIVPGWGDRAYALDSVRYGFQHFSGNITWRPSPVFNMQLGREKHFWGDGHRSLFLSDISGAFPYIRMQTTIWRLQYTSLFGWLQDRSLSTQFSSQFRSKFGSFHYISFEAAKWLNIGVFESVIFQGTDQNRVRWFDANYLNPLVFFRPVEYSLGSSDNAMLGFSGRINFNTNNVLYGQVILDEFFLKEIRNWSAGWWANKQGVQVGYKCFNFGQIDNLLLQTEVNVVRPYTYTHGSPQQNYSHAGMPLAHPMGANFAEWVGLLSYSQSRFVVTGKLVVIRFGKDKDSTVNLGQDIFKSYMDRTAVAPGGDRDYGHSLFDGITTNVILAQLHAAYTFNLAVPVRAELNAVFRFEKNVNRKLTSPWVSAGFSIPLWRAVDDY